MWLAFVLGAVFGWWFSPMFTDIAKNIWNAIKEWRATR
jgi:hypothetical protein